MTHPPRFIGDMVRERVSLIGEISKATADYLRMLQLNSGNEILLMKSPGSTESIDTKIETKRKTTSIQACIKELEASLEQLDRDIESTLAEEKE